ncbi:MAG: alpha/beta hydrolase [Theionarchaea archaeon]|nr:alpha/beta hydrolase [Theionarchaea archaeon]
MKPFDTIYKNVPQDQKEALIRFRSTHPYADLTVSNALWKYISCGKGKETLVLLPGGFRFPEEWFSLITALETEYKIISPLYPALPTMADHVKGIAALLETEKAANVHILGISFGGWLTQCFIRSHPDKVETVILSHTSGRGPSATQMRLAQILIPLYPHRVFRFGIKKGYSRLLTVPDSNREFWKAYIEEVAFNTTKDYILAQRKCFLDFTENYTFSKDDLADWPGRILIMESDNDQAFSKSAREALKMLYPSAQIHTFHRAGHMPLWNNPGEYISIVSNFLKAEE